MLTKHEAVLHLILAGTVSNWNAIETLALVKSVDPESTLALACSNFRSALAARHVHKMLVASVAIAILTCPCED
jgi:hypothetical protein